MDIPLPTPPHKDRHTLQHTPKGVWWLPHVHKSRHMLELGTARVRGKMTFLGQKFSSCSQAVRCYLIQVCDFVCMLVGLPLV